ncbi:MAG: hypothetical protein QW303_02810 [Nitrososphaerota archaeon]
MTENKKRVSFEDLMRKRHENLANCAYCKVVIPNPEDNGVKTDFQDRDTGVPFYLCPDCFHAEIWDFAKKHGYVIGHYLEQDAEESSESEEDESEPVEAESDGEERKKTE